MTSGAAMSNKWKGGFGMPAGMEELSDSEDDGFALSHSFQTPEKKTPEYDRKVSTARPDSNQENGGHQQQKEDPEQPAANGDGQTHRQQHHQIVPIDEFRMAATRGNLHVIQSSVQQGFEVDTILKSGWTALLFACNCGQPGITRYLLEQKANPNFHKERFTPLMAACGSTTEQESELLKCVTYVIEFGGEVNSFERHHVTPLMFAAREGRETIVKLLLEHGADVNAADNRGWTAVVCAIQRGHYAVVRTLLEADASVKDLKVGGQSLVDFAYQRGRNEIAELLEKFSKDKTLPELMEGINKTKDDVRHSVGKPFASRKSAYVQYGDLEMFLSGVGLTQLIPVFHAHELSFSDLLRLCEEDLTKIGIDKLGFRKRILDGIRDVHRAEWQDSSLPSRDKLISCPDAVCMVANIGKHLSYIQATIGYLRDEIQAQPRILEIGQDVNNVQTLLQRLDNAIVNNKNLHEELRFLKLHLDKIQGNVEYVPADLIVERRLPDVQVELKQRRGALVSLAAAVVLVGVAVIGTALKRPIVMERLLTWRPI